MTASLTNLNVVGVVMILRLWRAHTTISSEYLIVRLNAILLWKQHATLPNQKRFWNQERLAYFVRSCFIHKSSSSIVYRLMLSNTYSSMRLHRYAPVVNARRMRLVSTVWTLIRKYFTLRGIHLKMWWLSLLRTISSYSKTNSSISVCKYVNNFNWILAREDQRCWKL